MRNRMLNQSIVDSASLARCDLGAVVLFVTLLLLADDEGIAPLDPALITRKLFGARGDVAEEDVVAWLGQLEAEDCVRFYEADDGRYIAVTNFYYYQTINKPTPSKYPRPPWNHRPDNGMKGRDRVKMRCPKVCEETCEKPVENMHYGSATVALPTNRKEWKGREGTESPKDSVPLSSGLDEEAAPVENRRYIRSLLGILRKGGEA